MQSSLLSVIDGWTLVGYAYFGGAWVWLKKSLDADGNVVVQEWTGSVN
jgi:aspartyl aminopeptidase